MIKYSDAKYVLPAISDLRDEAKRRIPKVAFDYVDCAVGHEERGNFRNQSAFAEIELMCRYGRDVRDPTLSIELFGSTYDYPFGISPMGMPSLVWPGGEMMLARAAQKARIPFIMGMAAGATIEEIGRETPDVFWFQIHRILSDGLSVILDLMKRAQRAGAKVLVLTFDLATHPKRSRELKNRMEIPFRVGPRTIMNVMARPHWLAAFLRRGFPTFVNFEAYVSGPISEKSVSDFVRTSISGGYSFDEIAFLRENWPGKLVVKGVLDPDDAERLVALGVDGLLVSNHGGRQFEGAPATIDVLPSIAERVGQHVTLLLDGGVRSGLDIARAQACGARAIFAGRPFMYGLGALGAAGPDYVIDLFSSELRSAYMQVGASSVEELRDIKRFHPGRRKWE